jgi:pilus assembly protein CpaE
VGATFLSTHLAAALADRGLPTVLVDLDAAFSDVTAALGIEPGAAVRTIADLLPVIDELSPDHVEQVLVRHERGFAVLLGPPSDAADEVPAGLFSACVALLAGAYREVVLHIPRSMDTVARTGIEIADERFLVVALDLLSLYGARRAVGGLGLDRGGRSWRVLVNRARRGEVAPSDVERVLGRRPDATVRFDSAVPRVQNRGELLRAKSGRAWKDVARLAEQLAEDGAAGREEGA